MTMDNKLHNRFCLERCICKVADIKAFPDRFHKEMVERFQRLTKVNQLGKVVQNFSLFGMLESADMARLCMLLQPARMLDRLDISRHCMDLCTYKSDNRLINRVQILKDKTFDMMRLSSCLMAMCNSLSLRYRLAFQ
jgi:hypothetical protein